MGDEGLGMTSEIDACFLKNTETKLMKNGRVEIHCKRGLWGVSADTEEEAVREAKHYFIQYFEDGEYDRK
jgi:hypothetical protein